MAEIDRHDYRPRNSGGGRTGLGCRRVESVLTQLPRILGDALDEQPLVLGGAATNRSVVSDLVVTDIDRSFAHFVLGSG